MYTQKMINGIACCPACDKPAVAHGKAERDRAILWALSSDTGISSEAIARHMLGFGPYDRIGFQPPSDSSDRGRCIRLLELIPEWIPRLNEMRQYDEQLGDTLVISASGISADRNTWAKQIPLIADEGNFRK